MSEYDRTSRECSVSQLHPELRQAIQKYFQEHDLGDVQAETQMCCETISRRKNAPATGSWLSGTADATIHTGMLLTSQFLIWAQYGDQSGTRVNGADLNQIRADSHTSLFTKDAGLEIVGFIGGAKSRVRGYIGMGTEPAAQKFCEKVKQAIDKLNPPTKRSFFKWWPG